MRLKHNNSKFDQQYQVYLDDRRKVVEQLTGWVLHRTPAQYPFEAVDNFLKKHSPADALWRRIVVQDLSIHCLAPCFKHMDTLDSHLFAHAAYELQPVGMKNLADSGAEL